MNRYDRWGFVVLLLPIAAVLGAACQRLDRNLTGGRRLTSEVGVGGSEGTDDPGVGGSDGVQPDCPSLRSQAFAVLQTNCALCHQAPGTPALYLGSFSFILDLEQLTSTTSPSSAARPLKYVVNGSPADSYIYQRIVNNSMPPVTRTQRPSPADVDVLNQWITSCIDDPTSPEGWSGSSSPPDAGVDAGPALDSCGAASVCPDNGCCVFGKCRPNGTTCGPLPNPIPGQANLPGLTGTCRRGSCEKADGGGSCGSVGEACCDYQTCTASQSSCLTTDMSMCSACGGTGQPCCKPTVCLAGHVCLGARVGTVGTCTLCGGLGQPCCGTGVVALLTCDDRLTCVNDTASTTLCTDGADAGPADAGAADAGAAR